MGRRGRGAAAGPRRGPARRGRPWRRGRAERLPSPPGPGPWPRRGRGRGGRRGGSDGPHRPGQAGRGHRRAHRARRRRRHGAGARLVGRRRDAGLLRQRLGRRRALLRRLFFPFLGMGKGTGVALFGARRGAPGACASAAGVTSPTGFSGSAFFRPRPVLRASAAARASSAACSRAARSAATFSFCSRSSLSARPRPPRCRRPASSSRSARRSS